MAIAVPVTIMLVLLAVYLFLIACGSTSKVDVSAFQDAFIAHRGLFDNSGNCPENSLAAFKRAVDSGYGIELDVQLTADKELVVFHDVDLRRMCGVDKRLNECTYDELLQYRLARSDQHIPTFREVLAVVDAATPLVVEIKPHGDWLGASQQARALLKDAPFPYCVESFNPLVVRWFKKECPDVLRGQLSTDYFKDGLKGPWIANFALTNLLLNFLGRPHFIAYNYKYSSQVSYSLCRLLFKPLNVAWTIKSQAQLDQAKEVFQVYIFDSFIPSRD